MKKRVKICGVTSPEQAIAIVRAGADYVGSIVDFLKSPRSVDVERAREIREEVEDSRGGSRTARTVGVVIDKPLEELKRIIDQTGIRIVQLHGSEDEDYIKELKALGVEVWKVTGFSVPSAGADKVVVDAVNPEHGAGGSGKLSNWNFARDLVYDDYSVVLSGGLNPENVVEAIRTVRPDVVDVSSGVESSPGVKDISLVKEFISKSNSFELFLDFRLRGNDNVL